MSRDDLDLEVDRIERLSLSPSAPHPMLIATTVRVGYPTVLASVNAIKETLGALILQLIAVPMTNLVSLSSVFLTRGQRHLIRRWELVLTLSLNALISARRAGKTVASLDGPVVVDLKMRLVKFNE